MGTQQVLKQPSAPDWWTKDDAIGDIPLDQLAEDVEQPRRFIEGGPLTELAESIKASGVRQPIIITPRHLAPWIAVKPEEEDRFFVKVAGHRRSRASEIAGMKTIRAIIRIYADDIEHEKDLLVTNAHGKGLAELEQAYEIRRLRKKERSWAQISQLMGITAQTCQNRLKLTYLAPAILDRELDPSISSRDRMGMKLAETLADLSILSIGELLRLHDRFDSLVEISDLDEESQPRDLFHAHQLIWCEEIRKRGLNDQRAIQFIETGNFGRKTGAKGKGGTERHQPKRRKDIMNNFIAGVGSGLVLEWDQGEIDRILYNTSYGEVQGILKDAYAAKAEFFKFLEKLERVRDRKKPR